MPLNKLQFKPGIVTDLTNYSGKGGWYDCDKIRFLTGFPQKVGGWVKATPNTFIGTCRQMWNWITTFTDNFLAVGTNIKLYIESSNGVFSDITPLRDSNPTYVSPATNNCISVSNGSNLVKVTLTSPYSAVDGNYVTVSGVAGTTIGGIPVSQINGNYPITGVVGDPDSFTYAVATTATSSVTATGGTAIQVDFEIEPGNAATTAGYGWGTGPWGINASGWGLGSTTPVYLPQQDWWFDNFYNDLIANIRNGTPYYWYRGSIADPSTALSTRAVPLQTVASNGGFSTSAVPVVVGQLLVSQQSSIVIAFGAVPYGSTNPTDYDSLLIRWSDQGNPGQWEPLATNAAGFLRVSRGSRIVAALATRQEILVLTDSALFSLQFLGTTQVFGLQEYQEDISIMSPRAAVNVAGVSYWMGSNKFYVYSGVVSTLPCTVRDHVFNNLNYQQAAQVMCGNNEQWNEIWWFYPSASSNWNDSYVVYNYVDHIWYFGSMVRTAWLDTPLRTYPQAASTAQNSTVGYLYNHEDGVDDDTVPMTAYIKSSDFDVGDGEQFMLCKRIIPDVSFGGSALSNPTPTVTMQIYARNFPGSTYQNNPATTQPVVETSVDVYTEQVFIRARARQMAFQIRSSTLGVQWQLGSPRLDARPDGKR